MGWPKSSQYVVNRQSSPGSNAQCTPTDWQSAVGDIADWQSAVGDIADWQSAVGDICQLPTENRRSSVGVYQTPTRSSALIGMCALISRQHSTVGGKLTNHRYHFQLLPGYFPGTREPRVGGNLCLNWLQLFHAFS